MRHTFRLTRSSLALSLAAFVTLAPLAAHAQTAKPTATPSSDTAPKMTPKPPASGAKTAAAPSPSAPFWSGTPTAAQFKQRNEARIGKAKSEIAKLLAVKGPRTIENTLVPYDAAIDQLDQAGSQSGLIEEVHPNAAVRSAAEKVTQDVAAYATEISLNHNIYEALKGLDAPDAETKYYLTKELRDF